MENSDCCKNSKRDLSRGKVGEIATLLIIASLVVIGVSTIASTFLSKGRNTTSSRAAAGDSYFYTCNYCPYGPNGAISPCAPEACDPGDLDTGTYTETVEPQQLCYGAGSSGGAMAYSTKNVRHCIEVAQPSATPTPGSNITCTNPGYCSEVGGCPNGYQCTVYYTCFQTSACGQVASPTPGSGSKILCCNSSGSKVACLDFPNDNCPGGSTPYEASNCFFSCPNSAPTATPTPASQMPCYYNASGNLVNVGSCGFTCSSGGLDCQTVGCAGSCPGTYGGAPTATPTPAISGNHVKCLYGSSGQNVGMTYYCSGNGSEDQGCDTESCLNISCGGTCPSSNSNPTPTPTRPVVASTSTPTPTPIPTGKTCPGWGKACSQTKACQDADTNDCGLECCTTDSCGVAKGTCIILGGEPPPNKLACKNNACVGVYDPLCDAEGNPNNTHCMDKCGPNAAGNADCGAGGYQGNECICKAAPQCNTGGATNCSPDWSCIENLANKSAVNKCYAGSGQYSEDMGSPASATLSKSGENAVFTGSASDYYSATWKFLWTKTNQACTAQIKAFSMKSGQWNLASSQNISTTSCKNSACTLGANWQGQGVSDRVLVNLGGYTNDQTDCAFNISQVKLRHNYVPPRNGTVYGKVYVDENNDCKKQSKETLTVKNANIRSTNSALNTFTDKSGSYSIVAAEGKYTLIVDATKGYSYQCGGQQVSVTGNKQVMRDFMLKKKMSQSETELGTCPKKPQGDTNCDDVINETDYNIWVQEYTGQETTQNADFNRDGRVDLIDYEIWRRHIGE